MAYCNRKTYALRYSDFDFKDELSLTALLALVQESACRSADELGFGYDDLKPLHYGFLVVNTYCKFRRPIRLGETITVETWPLPPRHVIFERHYRVLSGEEEVAALASRWCLVDMNDFSLLLPEKLGETNEKCPYRNEKTVEVPNWKIAKLTEGREVYRMRVNVSHCDHYLHANNTRYLDFFTDCFTMEELSRKRISSFCINYIKQAKEGKEIVLLRQDLDSYTICEACADGDVLTRFRVDFAEDGQ